MKKGDSFPDNGEIGGHNYQFNLVSLGSQPVSIQSTSGDSHVVSKIGSWTKQIIVSVSQVINRSWARTPSTIA